MNVNTFLYRRLARWVTCELTLPFNNKLALQSKYEVASFQDVFCHPFYWQIFHYVTTPPKLIVDCGANCGHFSLLAEICLQAKFTIGETAYILVEPNSKLLPTLHKTIASANLADRVQVYQALLGRRAGENNLWVHSKNYLSAGVTPVKGAKPQSIPYLDLQSIINNRIVDIMKVDIEGSEYEFINSNLDLFRQVNMVLMELHDDTDKLNQKLLQQLQFVNLYPVLGPLQYGDNKMVLLLREQQF